MPYLAIFELSNHNYVYVRHAVRECDKIRKVYLAYLGPLEYIQDPSNRLYDPELSRLCNLKLAGESYTASDRQSLKDILDRRGIDYSREAVMRKVRQLPSVSSFSSN